MNINIIIVASPSSFCGFWIMAFFFLSKFACDGSDGWDGFDRCDVR